MFPMNRAAIHAVTNLRPHAGQSFSRDFWYMLTHFLSIFGNRAPQRVDNRHQTLHRPSAQRCHSFFPPNHREPQIIAHQKVTGDVRLALAQCRQTVSHLTLPAPRTASFTEHGGPLSRTHRNQVSVHVVLDRTQKIFHQNRVFFTLIERTNANAAPILRLAPFGGYSKPLAVRTPVYLFRSES